MDSNLLQNGDLFESDKTNEVLLPVEIIGENNSSLLLYEKDFGLDPNVINGALFNWTEHVVYEKIVKFRHRTVSIVGASKSKEQIKEELKKNKNNTPDVNITNKQLPICGDVEARMYFAILKLFNQQSTVTGIIPRKIITTYQEIKKVMGLTATSSTSDLKDSLFRLAHTRYDFKDSYVVRSGDNAASVRQSHSLYLLNYYELEVASIKNKIDAGESIEDSQIIEDTLKKLFNKRGKPTATLLKIILDEEQWKNLSKGYNLLYSYEHLKRIPKAVARGLYLFLDPNQGVLFTNGRIVRTNISNIFTVKAQYIAEYLGSSEINATRSLGRINKALELLKSEGYIKNFGFVTNTRKVLDGIYDIEFFPEQSRSQKNQYSSFMVQANPNALMVPITAKTQIDKDYEEIMQNFHLLVGNEKLLISKNRSSLRAIYYDESNIAIASYMSMQLDKTYGYYYLNGILRAITLSKNVSDYNSLIRGIIVSESNPESKATGYRNHASELMKKDFIKKYGESKLSELTINVVQGVKNQFISNSDVHATTKQLETDCSWNEFIKFYSMVYDHNNDRLNEFNQDSRNKLLEIYHSNSFYAIRLANYVVDKGKDVNAYLSGHGIDKKLYVSEDDADILKLEYQAKLKKPEKRKKEELVKKLSIEQDIINKNEIEAEYNKLSKLDQQKYIQYANKIISKYNEKLSSIFKNNLEQTLVLSVYARSNDKIYDNTLELFVINILQVNLKVL